MDQEADNGPLGTFNSAQLDSYLRFCEEKTGEVIDGIPLCHFSKSRPFSGLRLAERKHPWCRQWKLAVSKSVNPEMSHEMGFYCADREIPSWCTWGEGFGYGAQINSKPSNIDFVGASLDPSSLPVNGLYCRRRK
jgi:hypothetical protein